MTWHKLHFFLPFFIQSFSYIIEDNSNYNGVNNIQDNSNDNGVNTTEDNSNDNEVNNPEDNSNYKTQGWCVDQAATLMLNLSELQYEH